MHVIEARGLPCPEPLEQLIRAVHDGCVGDTIALRLADRMCLNYVLDWVERSDHGLLGMYEGHGFDEVVVEIRR